MSSCATTGDAWATPDSVYSPPGPSASESNIRYGTASDVWVFNAQGVA